MNTYSFRAPFAYDTDKASLDAGLLCEDESLALQSEKDDADINVIVKRFGLTGQLPDDLRMPVSGDFTQVPDFHTAMNLVRQTQEEFLKVPAEVRAEFGNDPQAFMAFFEKEENRERAQKLGLLKPPVVPPPPVRVEMVNTPPDVK